MVSRRKDDWARWQWGKMVKGKVGRGRDGKGQNGKKSWGLGELGKHPLNMSVSFGPRLYLVQCLLHKILVSIMRHYSDLFHIRTFTVHRSISSPS